MINIELNVAVLTRSGTKALHCVRSVPPRLCRDIHDHRSGPAGLLLVVSGALLTAGCGGSEHRVACPVTPPEGPPPPRLALLNLGRPIAKASDPGWRGNGTLWTQFQSPIPTLDDKATGMIATKLPWFRAVSGPVTLAGKPLSGPGARFEAEVGTVAAYGPTGFVPSVLKFGRAGCWRLDARLATQVLSLVLSVPTPTSKP